MEIFKHHRSLYQIESFNKRLLSESISSNSESLLHEHELDSPTTLANEVGEEQQQNIEILQASSSPPVNIDLNQQEDNVFNDESNICKPGMSFQLQHICSVSVPIHIHLNYWCFCLQQAFRAYCKFFFYTL